MGIGLLNNLEPEKADRLAMDSTDGEMNQKLKDLQAYYENAEAKLGDSDYSDLISDDSAWEKEESAPAFNSSEFENETDLQRKYNAMNEIYANSFKEKRKEAIKMKKEAEALQEISEKEPSTAEKLEKLGGNTEAHRAYWEKMTNVKGKK